MITTGAGSVLPLVVLLLVTHANRAATQDAPNSGSRKVAVVTRAEAPLTIDGALDDAAWQMAMPLTNFVQADPLEGEAPTEQTEVRLLFDDEALYVGVINYDSDPAQIVTTDTRRDSSNALEFVFLTKYERVSVTKVTAWPWSQRGILWLRPCRAVTFVAFVVHTRGEHYLGAVRRIVKIPHCAITSAHPITTTGYRNVERPPCFER